MFRQCAVLALQNYQGDVLVVENPALNRQTVGIQVFYGKDENVSLIVDLGRQLNNRASQLTGLSIPPINFVGSYDERDIPEDIREDDELMLHVPVFEVIVGADQSWHYMARNNLKSYWVPLDEVTKYSSRWLDITQLDRNVIKLIAKKTRPLLPIDFVDGKRDEVGIENITPRAKLKELSLYRRTQLEYVIGLIEHQLWLAAYTIPLSFKISYPVHPDTMKLVRQHYISAGYDIDVKDDPYPCWTVSLS